MKYSKGWEYRTEAEEKVDVPEMQDTVDHDYIQLRDGQIIIDNQYAWNGASFVLFRWFGTPGPWKVPSLVHDALYQLGRESLLPLSDRKTMDGIFYRLLMERCPWPRLLFWVPWVIMATVAYYAVRMFGNYALRHGPKVHEAE